jgi:hypothetical protein
MESAGEAAGHPREAPVAGSTFRCRRSSATRRDQDDYGLLCEVYQHVRRRVGFGGEPAYADGHTVRLSVGGRTAEEAEQNWSIVAGAFRDMSTPRASAGRACVRE